MSSFYKAKEYAEGFKDGMDAANGKMKPNLAFIAGAIIGGTLMLLPGLILATLFS